MDSWYLFETMDRDWRPYRGVDYEISKKMVEYWVNFIKTGNPNGEGGVKWERYSIENPVVMQIGERFKMEKVNPNERMKFRKRFVLEN